MRKLAAIVLVIFLSAWVVAFATVIGFAQDNRFQYQGSYWSNSYSFGSQQVEVTVTCDTQTGTLIYTSYAENDARIASGIALLPNGCQKT